ncbi:MAG: 50S ribosomal protein L11 methyltransferase [Firmicutes bacterium]|nr:50S ribosomal protein L11 methyltransferase [Bacillota bacterium]
MAWLEITIPTAPESIEDTAARLTAEGFADLVIEDQREYEDFLEENRAYWDYIDETLQKELAGLSRIRLYLEDTDAGSKARLEQVCIRLGLTFTMKKLEQTDWEESWKDNYPPQQVGKRLLVLPCWRAEEDTGGRIPVILDPGLTFGTGAHASTQLVMEAMEEQVTPDTACLDLGSGSGILSITALALGAKSAVGVDIDPKAEDIARENAAYNGFFAPRFRAMTGNVTENRKMMAALAEEAYDLVLVNIVADVIIGLCPVLPEFMGPDTLLICSGILNTRLEDVKAALAGAGLTVTSVRTREDWCCVTAKRGVL